MRRSERNKDSRLILMTSARREAGYRAQNPRLRTRCRKTRQRLVVAPLAFEQRLDNYLRQQQARGVIGLTHAQQRQLRVMRTRAIWRKEKTDA